MGFLKMQHFNLAKTRAQMKSTVVTPLPSKNRSTATPSPPLLHSAHPPALHLNNLDPQAWQASFPRPTIADVAPFMRARPGAQGPDGCSVLLEAPPTHPGGNAGAN
jgi:hypothetical protein